jgi:hypothetical protein
MYSQIYNLQFSDIIYFFSLRSEPGIKNDITMTNAKVAVEKGGDVKHRYE